MTKKTNRSWLLGLYKRSRSLRRYTVLTIDIGLTGFWLGVLSRSLLHRIDELYYSDDKMYYADKYNAQGLWDWEERVITEFFPKQQRIMLLGAGGGREVYGLQKWPFEIEAFECNPKLVEYANEFLTQHGVTASVKLNGRDECPANAGRYDGAIVGWGGYMLIQGKDRRVSFLKCLLKQLEPGSPVLISFFVQTGTRKKYIGVTKIANCLRYILGREPADNGDYLRPNYVHYFTKDQILAEFSEAGYELAFYSNRPYGHAVGLTKPID